MVERLVWDQEIVGSSPAIPMRGSPASAKNSIKFIDQWTDKVMGAILPDEAKTPQNFK